MIPVVIETMRTIANGGLGEPNYNMKVWNEKILYGYTNGGFGEPSYNIYQNLE